MASRIATAKRRLRWRGAILMCTAGDIGRIGLVAQSGGGLRETVRGTAPEHRGAGRQVGGEAKVPKVGVMSRPRGGQQNQGMSKWPQCGHGLAVVDDEGPEQWKTAPSGLIGSGTDGKTSVRVAGAGYDASG
ncbi:hypothetical protein MTO96_052355 [Rhipicephalus appendiculatus]